MWAQVAPTAAAVAAGKHSVVTICPSCGWTIYLGRQLRADAHRCSSTFHG